MVILGHKNCRRLGSITRANAPVCHFITNYALSHIVLLIKCEEVRSQQDKSDAQRKSETVPLQPPFVGFQPRLLFSKHLGETHETAFCSSAVTGPRRFTSRALSTVRSWSKTI